MRRLSFVIMCVVFVIVYIVALGKITEEAKKIPKGEDTAYVMPASILKITALEFDGLASDFLFLKSLVFLGSTYERKEDPRVKPWEWQWLYHTLDASANLDPYFFDPYNLANANLTWDGGLVREANALLERGCRYRYWDFLLPFYVGFNDFYFLDDSAKASEYLMEASRRPGASPLYADLAVKLAYKERRTENAITFQEYLLEHTDDPRQHADYEKRLITLRGVLYLEKATADYKQRFGRYPHDLQDLMTKHIIDKLPPEPYGGNYFIDSNGKVKTTSELKLMPYLRLNLFPNEPSLLLPGQLQ